MYDWCVTHWLNKYKLSHINFSRLTTSAAVTIKVGP